MLITRTPALRVLTTTRAPLGLAAERIYPLPQLARDDAVELFRERATAARPGVLLDDERVAALVDRLDGLPLAVELAAARVRVMSVEEIERRLDDRFALLRGGSRAAPERHQTLLAVIDWSWNLLDPDEQYALRRLAVFRDGFSLDGAAAVLEADDALDVVTRLVDQSLVVVTEADGGLRYRLLETVREFGRVQLATAGDEEDAERLLQDWATGFARVATETMFTPAQVEVDAPGAGRGGQPARRAHAQPGGARPRDGDRGDGCALEHVDGRGQPREGRDRGLVRPGRRRGRRRAARAHGPPAARAGHARPEHDGVLGVAGGQGAGPAARDRAGRHRPPHPWPGPDAAGRRRGRHREHRPTGRPRRPVRGPGAGDGATRAPVADPGPGEHRLDAGGVRGRSPGPRAVRRQRRPLDPGARRVAAGRSRRPDRRPGRRPDLRRGRAADDGRAGCDRGPHPAAGAAGDLGGGRRPARRGRADDGGDRRGRAEPVRVRRGRGRPLRQCRARAGSR